MSALVNERAAVAPLASKLGKVARLRNRLAALFAMLAALVVVPAGAASAQTTEPADLTGGAGDSFFGAITDYIQGPLGIATLTLFAIVTGFVLVMKWGRKSATK